MHKTKYLKMSHLDVTIFNPAVLWFDMSKYLEQRGSAVLKLKYLPERD